MLEFDCGDGRPLQILRRGDFAIRCLLDWPFFVFAATVKGTFLKHWPDAKAAQAAIVGGRPFGFVYSFFVLRWYGIHRADAPSV
jgi:hypothetical protein